MKISDELKLAIKVGITVLIGMLMLTFATSCKKTNQAPTTVTIPVQAQKVSKKIQVLTSNASSVFININNKQTIPVNVYLDVVFGTEYLSKNIFTAYVGDTINVSAICTQSFLASGGQNIQVEELKDSTIILKPSNKDTVIQFPSLVKGGLNSLQNYIVK